MLPVLFFNLIRKFLAKEVWMKCSERAESPHRIRCKRRKRRRAKERSNEER